MILSTLQNLSHTTIFETSSIEIQNILEVKKHFDPEIFQSPDYFELKIIDKQSIGIKETREMINWLQLKPYQFEYKLACIISAEKMTAEAQNSLLKTLEEPPANSFIILLTPNHKRLLRTIISRSRVIKINDKKYNGEEGGAKGNLAAIVRAPLKEQIKWIEGTAKIKSPTEKKQYVYDFLEELHNILAKENGIEDNNSKKLHNMKLIEKTYIGLRRNVNLKLLLENLLFNYA